MSEQPIRTSVPFVRVPTCVLTDYALAPVEFMTYCAVLKHMNKDTRKARPSHATLAGIVGVSPRTIKRALESLKAQRLITWAENSGGRGKAREYAVLDTADGGRADNKGRPDQGTKKGDTTAQVDTLKGDTAAPLSDAKSGHHSTKKGDTTAQVGALKGDTTAPLSDAKGGHHSTGSDIKRVTNRTQKGGHQSTNKGDKPDTKRVTNQPPQLDIENKSLEQEILNKKKESLHSDSDSRATASDAPAPIRAPSQSEQQRIMRKIMELNLAKQDAKTDDEREALTQRVEDYIAQLRGEYVEAPAAGVSGSGGSADRRGADRTGGSAGMRADRLARGLLPDQAPHDLAGDERHAPARGGD